MATAHKLARSLYNLMRHGIACMRKEEEAYAKQVRERLEKQLQRRAGELGYELTKIEPPLETVTMPDDEVVMVKSDSEIVNGSKHRTRRAERGRRLPCERAPLRRQLLRPHCPRRLAEGVRRHHRRQGIDRRLMDSAVRVAASTRPRCLVGRTWPTVSVRRSAQDRCARWPVDPAPAFVRTVGSERKHE